MASDDVKGPTPGRRIVQRIWGQLVMVRYLFVGVSLVVLGLLVLTFLVRVLGVELRLAEAVSRLVGAGAGFFAHKYVTFQARAERQVVPVSAQGASYVVVALVNIGISPWILYALYQILEPHLVLAKILTDAVMVIETFILLRLIFWSKKQAA
jgi:putative flippase GtrA